MNFQYDANGNLVSGDGKFRVYNSLNQLSKVYNGNDTNGLLFEEFIYHPIKERVLVKKVYNNDSSLKETVYYVDENFVSVVNSSGSYNFTYVKHEGMLVAQEVSGVKHYIHSDHLGSNTVVTDNSGTVVENTTYSPFGEVVEGGEATRYGYEGKEHDRVVGDTDFNFRKYKADWGIFTQPDTLIPNVYDPQKLNRYMFERGNPLKNVDPTGHEQQTTDNFLTRVMAGVALGQENQMAIEANLYNELIQKYTPNTDIKTYTCAGCETKKPSFIDLQKKELEKELSLILDEEEIEAFQYKDQTVAVSNIKDVGKIMHRVGFSEKVVSKIAKDKYYEKTGKSWTRKRASDYLKSWKNYFSELYAKLLKAKKKE